MKKFNKLRLRFYILFPLFVVMSYVFFATPYGISAATVDCTNPANKTQAECVFGEVKPPTPIANLLKGDATGTSAIGQFLSNFIALIYSVATIAVLLMFVWGAWDWIISEGNKDKIAGAQKKIVNAIIGFVLLAIAFGILNLIGSFTGFSFFKGSAQDIIRQQHECYRSWEEWDSALNRCVDRR